MSLTQRTFTALAISLLALPLVGCEEEPAPAPKWTSPQPSMKATAPAPPAPAPPPEPKHDCPEGSSGVGSFDHPCEAKGPLRTMEVQWTGKIGDDGPSFRITNVSPLVIQYGKIVVYFYDKSGKQLEVPSQGDKPRTHQSCSGKIFGGAMHVKEKAVITFSCVKKDHVPEDAKAIEGEITMVGFADANDEKKVDFYWTNPDLAPDERPKGGIDAKDAKKKKK